MRRQAATSPDGSSRKAASACAVSRTRSAWSAPEARATYRSRSIGCTRSTLPGQRIGADAGAVQRSVSTTDAGLGQRPRRRRPAQTRKLAGLGHPRARSPGPRTPGRAWSGASAHVAGLAGRRGAPWRSARSSRGARRTDGVGIADVELHHLGPGPIARVGDRRRPPSTVAAGLDRRRRPRRGAPTVNGRVARARSRTGTPARCRGRRTSGGRRRRPPGSGARRGRAACRGRRACPRGARACVHGQAAAGLGVAEEHVGDGRGRPPGPGTSTTAGRGTDVGPRQVDRRAGHHGHDRAGLDRRHGPDELDLAAGEVERRRGRDPRSPSRRRGRRRRRPRRPPRPRPPPARTRRRARGGAHRSSAARRICGSSLRASTSSSATGCPASSVDLVAHRRAVDGERGLAVRLDLEAVRARDARRERRRRPRRPARRPPRPRRGRRGTRPGSRGGGGRCAPRRRRRGSPRRRPPCRRARRRSAPCIAGVPRLASQPGSTTTRVAQPLAQPVGDGGDVGGRHPRAAAALDHLAVARSGPTTRDASPIGGGGRRAARRLVAQEHRARPPPPRGRPRRVAGCAARPRRRRAGPRRRRCGGPRSASRSRLASITATLTSPRSMAAASVGPQCSAGPGHLEVEPGVGAARRCCGRRTSRRSPRRPSPTRRAGSS